MEPPPRPDSDFDFEPTARVRLDDPGTADHRRVVVNPFLAILGAIIWLALARWVVAGRPPIRRGLGTVAVFFVILVLSVPWLLQFHCLDCGRTGPYPRLRRHACPGFLARVREDRASPTLFPRPRTQFVVWCYLIGSATLIWIVSGLSGR